MIDPVIQIAHSIEGWLTGLGLSPDLVKVILVAIGVVVLAVAVLLLDIFLVWVERKVVARFQDRLGPNRIGPFGLFQPIPDVIKLLIKEDTTPKGADRFIFNIPPIIALATVIMLWAVIPLTPALVGSDINVGLLYIVAVGSISTLGIIMAGWSSNNKYALLGAVRTVAQMVSYEVPMVITLLVPVILAGSMGINQIVAAQQTWFIVLAPVAALITLITSIAELGRAPFDLNEAESEIVAGFHIEYSGMKFGMFYAGELLHALTMGALFSSLYLGGWRGPFVEQFPPLGIIYLLIKAFFVYYVFMWVRYSMPRIRIDHMLDFNWKFLTPLSLAVVVLTAVLDKLLVGVPTWIFAGVMLLSNLALGWIALTLVRKVARRERQRVAEPRPVVQPQVRAQVRAQVQPQKPPLSTTP